MSGTATRRVFFALWPTAAIRRGIVARRRAIEKLRRRRVPEANLHATLLFLGDRPASLVERLCKGPGVRGISAFELVLDRFGWFAGARVAWLGGDAPSEGRRLVESLRTECAGLGVAVDDRPWVPHVTLFRKVPGRPDFPDVAPLRWPVTDYALVESIPNRPYQVLRTWRLE